MRFILQSLSFCRVLLIILSSGVLITLWRLKYMQGGSNLGALKKKLGKQISQALQSLGPAFTKLGQALSTRVDLLGEEVVGEFIKLTDSLPQFSFNEVRCAIKDQLGKDIEEIFIHFERKAVAAASIAQVHKAVTQEGREVAVKVLRPKIEKKIKNDVRLLHSLAKLSLCLFADAKRLRPIEVVESVKNMTTTELDLRFEASAADKLRENCKADTGVHVPAVLWLLTAKRVLTLEWVEGIPISDTDRLINEGYDLTKLAEYLSITFFNQAFRDGFFHADIHSGNIFVNKKNEIVLVDFGIMGHLDYKNRLFVADILHGFINRDYKKVADLHFNAGYVPERSSRELFELACRSIGEPIVGQPVDRIAISGLLKQLFEVSKDFDMETQPQLLLLQKTMVTVEGTGYSLHPEVNMWQLAEPWINEWAKDNLGYKRRLKTLKYEVKDLMKFIKDMPYTSYTCNTQARSTDNALYKGIVIGIALAIIIGFIYQVL